VRIRKLGTISVDAKQRTQSLRVTRIASCRGRNRFPSINRPIPDRAELSASGMSAPGQRAPTPDDRERNQRPTGYELDDDCRHCLPAALGRHAQVLQTAEPATIT
jgi:hypothetical protein